MGKKGISNGTGACVQCGAATPARRSAVGRPKMYCSLLCRSRAQARSTPSCSFKRVCETCGAHFVGRKTAAFCSKTCYGKSLRRIEPMPACKVCGKEGKRSDSVYCSKQCCDAAFSRGVDHWKVLLRHWRGQARTRAKRYGVRHEDVDIEEIFNRDGWICGICGSPVDRGLRFPDTMRVSPGHKLPMSQGRSHTPANIQCSHLVCNLQKGCDERAKTKAAAEGIC